MNDTNSAPAPAEADSKEVAAAEILQFVERLERLDEEKKGIAEDMKDVFAELKGRGFDVKTVREILRLRKLDEAERQEAAAMLQIYAEAIGLRL